MNNSSLGGGNTEFYYEYLNILKNLNGYGPAKKIFKGKNSPEKYVK